MLDDLAERTARAGCKQVFLVAVQVEEPFAVVARIDFEFVQRLLIETGHFFARAHFDTLHAIGRLNSDQLSILWKTINEQPRIATQNWSTGRTQYVLALTFSLLVRKGRPGSSRVRLTLYEWKQIVPEFEPE